MLWYICFRLFNLGLFGVLWEEGRRREGEEEEEWGGGGWRCVKFGHGLFAIEVRHAGTTRGYTRASQQTSRMLLSGQRAAPSPFMHLLPARPHTWSYVILIFFSEMSFAVNASVVCSPSFPARACMVPSSALCLTSNSLLSTMLTGTTPRSASFAAAAATIVIAMRIARRIVCGGLTLAPGMFRRSQTEIPLRAERRSL